MRKVISLLIAIIMIISLTFGVVGCSTTGETKKVATETTSKQESASPKVDEDQIVLKHVKNYFETLPKDINKIDYKDLKSKLDANDPTIQVVDIRKPEDFAKGHIKGAVNVPFGKDISENLNKIDKGKTNVIVCYTGQTAGQTTALLKLAGYDAKALHLGMKGWSDQPDSGVNNGFTVVTD